MKRFPLPPFLLFILFPGFFFQASGQTDPILIKIRELHTEVPLPFATTEIENGYSNLADIDGYYRMEIDSFPVRLRVKHHLYRESEVLIESRQEIPEIVYLHRQNAEIPSKTSDPSALSVIRAAVNGQKRSRKGSFRYKSYNKFTVTAERSGQQEKWVNRAFDFLTNDYMYLDSIHLFMMESSSVRNKRSRRDDREEIIALRSSGLILPHLYAYIVHPQPVDLSKNHLTLANHPYTGPLCRKPWKTFAFTMADTIDTGREKIYAIHFAPLPGKAVNTVKGMIYISDDGFQPVAISAGPAQENKLETRIFQEYSLHEGTYVPHRYRTSLTFIKKGLGEVKISMIGRSVVHDFSYRDTLEKYDEVVLDFPLKGLRPAPELWEQERKEALSRQDSATFLHPARIRKFPAFMLHLSEHIYFGRIPAGKADIDLGKVFSTNYQEGVRLGVGLVTNSSFSRNWKLSCFTGFGLKDRRWKYGLGGSYLFNLPMEPVAEVFYNHELVESGGFNFPFHSDQYKTEHLRKYRLSIMDYVSEIGAGLYLHPLRYLRLRARLSSAAYEPSYDYLFVPAPKESTETRSFHFIEASFGFRYAFGEQYIKTPDYEINLGAPYPVLWINYTHSVPGFGNDNQYERFDLRLQQTVKIFRLGTSGIQLLTGITSRKAPYMKLYNGMGSLRNLSVVVNNSFETMEYNEFLSDRFFAVFYSHDFGRLYYPDPVIQPSLIMVHNFGWGALSRPENHEHIPFKTMEKGYFESGMFIQNLFVVKLSALKTGLGFGFFLRYGPYAHQKRSDNVVFKLAFNFML